MHQAVFDVFEFWLKMGVDGLRLDAIPYLYEREGTNCENLPETHAFLKKLRAQVQEKFPHVMLLAEANQWPEDAAEYFGDGDECHMNFHFPIMPRLYMSLQMEDRFPIIDILEQTPAIPANCQWATFLRNHDELTLEMVTDEERDYMWRVYAADPRARINLGIRRRLAPLLNNNRRRIELINALLFSLPGTPIVYYGDEIGMGDNFYLGDRNGVRTPMQWAPDRNGGFSKANPQQLFLPTILDPEYHFEAINVENQRRNQSSLFWWTRRLIAERKRWHAFGHGNIQFLHPRTAKVLAFTREHGDETVLVVANLSRFTQAAEIDLSAYAGLVPMEIFSRSKFPELRAGGTMFTLGPHDFYWLALRRKGATASAEAAASPVIEGAVDWRSPLPIGLRQTIETELLPSYFQNCRWFPSRSRQAREFRVTEEIALRPETTTARILLVHVTFAEGMPETFIVPVQLSTGDNAARIAAEAPHAVIGRFRSGGEEQLLHDGTLDATFRAALLETIAARTGAAGGRIASRLGRSFSAVDANANAATSQILSSDHTNTTIAYGTAYVLKLYRRLEWGRHPEEEIIRHLSEGRDFQAVPSYAGSLQYRDTGGMSAAVALLLGYVQNQGDAWAYTVDAAGRYFERVLGARPSPGDPDALFEAIGGVFPERARQLGQRTAELHLALATEGDDPAFAPEPFGSLYQRSLFQAVRGNLRRTVRKLVEHRSDLPENAQAAADEVIRHEAALLARFNGLLDARINALKTVIHGSLHLGQVLNTGKDFVILDLEGDPERALSERNLKRSALRDVAAMLRSFDYAAHSALKRQQPADLETLHPWAHAWTRQIGDDFLSAYLDAAAGAPFLPDNKEHLQLLLDIFLIDRAASEISNELTYRPHMVAIPIEALRRLIERDVEPLPATA